MIRRLYSSPKSITLIQSWENIKQTQIEGCSIKYMNNFSKVSWSWKTKKDINCHRLKETWQLNAMWYPGLDPGTEKGHYGNTGEVQIKSMV